MCCFSGKLQKPQMHLLQTKLDQQNRGLDSEASSALPWIERGCRMRCYSSWASGSSETPSLSALAAPLLMVRETLPSPCNDTVFRSQFLCHFPLFPDGVRELGVTPWGLSAASPRLQHPLSFSPAFCLLSPFPSHSLLPSVLSLPAPGRKKSMPILCFAQTQPVYAAALPSWGHVYLHLGK